MPFRILVFACAWLLIVGGIPVVGAQNGAYTVYLPLVIRDATYRTGEGTYYNASSRDIFGCSKNRQNRIVENSTYPLDDFGFR